MFNSCVFEIWWLPKGQKDDVSSFSLNSIFAILPQFIFNLRHSQFVQVFNNSSNETTYFCMLLNIKNVTNFIVYFCWMHTLVLLSFMVWLLLSGATRAIIINHSIRHLLNCCKHLMMMYMLLSRNDFLHLDWLYVNSCTSSGWRGSHKDIVCGSLPHGCLYFEWKGSIGSFSMHSWAWGCWDCWKCWWRCYWGSTWGSCNPMLPGRM